MTLRTDWVDGEDVHDTDLNDIGTEVNGKYGPGGTDVPVTDGGTGRSTSTTAYGLIAAGTTATGPHQTLAAGAATDMLVGGGASALPAWTTATGTGAPVRANSPTLVTPALGTPSSGNLANCTGLTTTGVDAATLVTASETIGSNNNDTTIPTSAAVKAYADSIGGTVDTVAAGTGVDVDSTDPSNPIVSIESGVYRSGGTDVALADGGTGASLTDPNADRIMFWDDSAGAVDWLTVSTGLSITGTTLAATGGGGGGLGAVSDDTAPQLGGNLDLNGHLVGAASAADLTKLAAITASAATINNQSGTNTGDQTSVTGNAGTATALQTARNIDGQAFDGTANITVIAPGTHAATSKSSPVDADEIPLVDSAASNVLKKLPWANLKSTLKTYFDSLTTTLTNKRITKRVVAITLSATPAINTDNMDVAQIMPMTTAITNLSTNLTGTPTSEQQLMIVFSSASALGITHGSSFQDGAAPLLTTTVAGKTHRELHVWDSAASKWTCLASDATGY